MIEFPKLQGTIDNKQVLLEDYTYRDITVPKGFRTNGSNVPRTLWGVVPPFKPLYSPAYVIHDYLCELEDYELADKYFKELLWNVDRGIVTSAMVLTVNVYHSIRYGKRL
jgi:hypothetical protein